MTSKLQVTLPKSVAEAYHIKPGDEIAFVPAGDVVRLETRLARPQPSADVRLELFDAATVRQQRRQKARHATRAPDAGRGWTREELYGRGRPR